VEPYRPDGTCILGKCGADLSDEAAVEAARVVGITMLATMRQQFGSLDNIVRIVKVCITYPQISPKGFGS
jgi:hypothetical protein